MKLTVCHSFCLAGCVCGQVVDSERGWGRERSPRGLPRILETIAFWLEKRMTLFVSARHWPDAAAVPSPLAAGLPGGRGRTEQEKTKNTWGISLLWPKRSLSCSWNRNRGLLSGFLCLLAALEPRLGSTARGNCRETHCWVTATLSAGFHPSLPAAAYFWGEA